LIEKTVKMKRKLGAARENGEITSRQGKEAQPSRRDERPSGKNVKYTSADYRIAVELSNDPAIILSKSRRLIFNQKFLECLGYSHPDEIAGKPLFFSIYPEDIGLVLERSRIRQTGKGGSWRYEVRLLHKDGSIVYTEVSSSLIEYEGEPAAFVYFRDISGRKQAEEALVKSESKYRSVIENIQDCYYRSDGEGRLVMTSPSGVRMFGYDSPDELIGKRMEEFWENPEDRKKVMGLIREKGSLLDIDAVFRKKDGALFHASLSANFNYDKDGRFMGTEGIVRDITVRKQAEAMYRTLAEKSIAGVYVTQNGYFRYLNSNAASYAGYTAEELTGKPWDFAVHPADRENARASTINMLQGGRNTADEFRIITRTGDIRWMMQTVAGIEYEGRPAILGNCMDITELKRTQEALRDSDREKSNVLNTISELVLYMDKDLKIISSNPAAAGFFNVSPDRMKGKHCYDVLHGRDEPCPVCPSLKAIQTGKPQTVADFFAHGRWWVMRGHPVWSGDDMIGVVEIAADITERKLAEDALRESEKKYRLLVEHAGDAIVIVQDGLFRFANPMALKITGCTLDELLDQPITRFIHADDLNRVMGIHRRRMIGENITDYYEFRGATRTGEEHWIEANAVAIEWQGRPAALAFLRDITRQKTLEARLVQSQKLESLGTLAGGVAHDFNNLLSGILGLSTLLEMDGDTTLRQQELLEGIKELVKSASGLTSQLLGFARMGRYEVKTADINEILERTSAMFGRTRKEIVLEKRLAPDLAPVEIDHTQWEHVFMNLFVNAWQAMPGGGTILIETANVKFGEFDPRPSYMKAGSFVKVSVTDTGAGMDEATRERIFEPFFTTKEMGRGTGLGLAMVYGIVKGHKGYIDVASEKGRGTTFNIYIPSSAKKLASEQRQAPEYPAGGTETVLLVDDEKKIVRIIGDILAKLGYRILTANSGRQALDIYRREKDRIDLVILDLIMPGMNSGEVYDSIKKINPEAKVILASGYSIDGQACEIMNRGCNAFIQKPFSISELSRKIRDVLE